MRVHGSGKLSYFTYAVKFIHKTYFKFDHPDFVVMNFNSLNKQRKNILRCDIRLG